MDFLRVFPLTDDSCLPTDKMKFIYKVHTICRNQYAQGVSGIGWWLNGQTTLNNKLFHGGGPLHSQLFSYNLSEVWEPCIKLKTKAILTGTQRNSILLLQPTSAWKSLYQMKAYICMTPHRAVIFFKSWQFYTVVHA